MSEHDDVRLATALFNEVKVDHLQEDVGRKFRIYQSWIVLREVLKYDHPKEFRGFKDSEGSKISEDIKQSRILKTCRMRLEAGVAALSPKKKANQKAEQEEASRRPSHKCVSSL